MAAAFTVFAAACGPAAPTPAPTDPSVSPTILPTGTPGDSLTAPAASPSPLPSPTDTGEPAVSAPAEVRYRIERRTTDEATAGFEHMVHGILTDPRGWSRAGFRFVVDPQAEYAVVLAEGAEVDRLCAPYETHATYSCQNGPIVALNADRWRMATPEWPADLDSYRVMLVNHEVGHLLHLHHPDPQCPGPGWPAPVMAQQSTSLGDCLPNPWPLDWEIALAAERREPLAPPADHDPSDHRPSPPRARS